MRSGVRPDLASALCAAVLWAGCASRSPLAIITETLPPAYLDTPYDQGLFTTGGHGALHWTLTAQDPELQWLGVDAQSGRLLSLSLPSHQAPQGVPFSVQVEDALGNQAKQTFMLAILPCVGTGQAECFRPSEAGVCLSGTKSCAAGKAGSCEPSAASSEVRACGAVCGNCGTSADACVEGICVCGQSGAPCPGGASCCGLGSEAGCIDTQSDPLNCGFCGSSCETSPNPHTLSTCEQGGCRFDHCAPGWARCGPQLDTPGCGIDLQHDPAHCGDCDTACPTSFPVTSHVTAGGCFSGDCSLICAPFYSDCDGLLGNGCETFANTVDHCGGCKACPAVAPGTHATSSWCSQGQCQTHCANDPPHHWDSCGKPSSEGCPIDLASDVNNCGACGHVCQSSPHGTVSCVASACVDDCASGFANCNLNWSDGCEVDLLVDPRHCGSCNQVCSGGNHGAAACAWGQCSLACSAPLANCDGSLGNGCEANLSSRANCGTCGHVCAAGSSCMACTGPGGFCCH